MDPEECMFLIRTMKLHLVETHAILTKEARRVGKVLRVLERLAKAEERENHETGNRADSTGGE